MRHIGKSFSGVRVLEDVQFDVRAGEVHVLAGENGAGKSTLMRILTGALPDYEGEILLEGRPVHFATPHEAFRRGLGIIHQELSLIPSLSVLDNIFLGREGAATCWARPRGRGAARAGRAGPVGARCWICSARWRSSRWPRSN
jgi:ribose transport system ATP-binding protein